MVCDNVYFEKCNLTKFYPLIKIKRCKISFYELFLIHCIIVKSNWCIGNIRPKDDGSLNENYVSLKRGWNNSVK